jgi:hypothetical protein
VRLMRERLLLNDSREVTVEEQLAMFMRIIGQNASNRDTQERFQHSRDTISKNIPPLYLQFKSSCLLTLKKVFPSCSQCLGPTITKLCNAPTTRNNVPYSQKHKTVSVL